jgi:hypothetical protein
MSLDCVVDASAGIQLFLVESLADGQLKGTVEEYTEERVLESLSNHLGVRGMVTGCPAPLANASRGG